VFQLISAIIDIILESINEMEKIESLEEIGIFHETILMLYSYLRDSFQFLMKFPPSINKIDTRHLLVFLFRFKKVTAWNNQSDHLSH
jgi:hypothetical protein